MNYLQEKGSLSPQNMERISSSCCCDQPRKPKKTVEEEIADKQLKELFRRDLKQDIFKLCQDKSYKGVRKSFFDGKGKKKHHFLPPLRKKTQKVKKTSDDYSRFRLQYGMGEDEDENYFVEGDNRFEMGEIEEMGEDEDGEKYSQGRYEDYDWNKDGRKSRRSKRSRESRSKRSIKRKHHRGSRDTTTKDVTDGSGKSNLNANLDGSSTDVSTDISSSMERIGLDWRDDRSYYGDTRDFSHKYRYDTDKSDKSDKWDKWDEHSNCLLKYFQLKKLAAKLNARDKYAKHIKRTENDEYLRGYQFGRDEGHKIAFNEPPIYEDNVVKDFVHDVSMHEDYVYEYYGEYEDSMNGSTYSFARKTPKTKIIYISTSINQVDELKQIYKEVEIKVVPPRRLSAGTSNIVANKVDGYIKLYKRTSLFDKTQLYTEGFIDGFNDGFHQKYIYQPDETMFNNDEKFYVNEVRKCLKNEDDDTVIDQVALMDRAMDLKAALKDIVDFDAYEREIEALELAKPLTFTKSDFIFFYSYENSSSSKKRKQGKSTSKSQSRFRSRVMHDDSFTKDIDEMTELRRKCKDMSSNRAWGYLNKHNIAEIFRYLGIMLCSHKPDDPIDFLINLLDKCLLFRENELRYKAPLVFTEKHVESIYSNMDPLNYGFIDGKQYLYGLNLLDVTEAEDMALVQNTDTVEKNLFLMNANDRLLEKFRTMIAIS